MGLFVIGSILPVLASVQRVECSFFEQLLMDYNVAFGTTFKRLRRLKRMTQEDFGSVVSERYVRMLEKGEYSPTLGTVADLAQVLQMSPVTLIALVQAEYLGLDAGKLLEEVLSEMQVFGGTDSTR